jgi:hypothetical protein
LNARSSAQTRSRGFNKLDIHRAFAGGEYRDTDVSISVCSKVNGKNRHIEMFQTARSLAGMSKKLSGGNSD